MQIDHAILAVGDLDRAGELLQSRHRLHSTVGGQHPGYGTANRIASLGNNQYLELMGVAEPDTATLNPLGQRVAALADGWLGWCVSVDDIDAVGAQLGLPVLPMSRTRPDGTNVSWRLAGLDAALQEPWLPFFISWDEPGAHPGKSPQPALGRTSIGAIAIEGDADQIDEWLAGATLPIEVRAGDTGVVEVRLATAEGELTLDVTQA